MNMLNHICGFDFGTSNSTIGIYQDNRCQLVPLENSKPIIRSAIFCDVETKRWVFGQAGVEHYLQDVPGRLLMSLKSVLGTALMDEETIIFNESIPYKKILSHFIKYIKTQAELRLDTELTSVVLGRPVHFHDHNQEKDNYAQQTLEGIAQDVGFKHIAFQYEPIAAALAYETNIQREQLALIVDMGGGTSDFTIIRLRPENQTIDRREDVLANTGIHIAGTDFDQRLSLQKVMPLLGMGSLMHGSSADIEVPSMFYHDLTTWHTLSNLYGANNISHIRSIQARAYQKDLLERLIKVLRMRAGHFILHTVERCKQDLSDKPSTQLDLTFIESSLESLVTQQDFDAIIDYQVQQIIDTVETTVQEAGIKHADINAIFYTGGSTKIPLIREKINALFPTAEVVQGDAFGSVGLGLTIDATRRFA